MKDRSAPAAATLIERDGDGRIKRLDLDPALAALEMVALDAKTREEVDKVLVARMTVLDRIVRDNFIAIAELGQANQAGDRKAARKLLAELYAKARPYLSRGPLVEELRPVLPAETHAKLSTLVNEYTKACIDDRAGRPGEDGQPQSRVGAVFAENLHVLGQEVRRSYERSVQSGGDEFDRLIKELGLTPEQEGKIRTRVTDAYLKSRGKPTKLEAAKLFLQSYQDLDAEQRQRLIRIINEKRALEREDKGPKPLTKPDAKSGARPDGDPTKKSEARPAYKSKSKPRSKPDASPKK